MNGPKNKKIRGILILVSVLLTLSVIFWLGFGRSRTTERTIATPVAQSVPPFYVPSSSTLNPQLTSELQRPGGPYVSSDPRWAIVREKDKVDHNWEWRMPINFYGRVVDENDQPIVAANVEFSWTDLSPAGSSAARTASASDGTFSLQGKTGRHLQVDVSKEGFYKVRNERLKSFDYAAFWEANYYEPDRARPVTFHLRKKGVAAPLAVGEIQPPISADGTPTRLDLLSNGRVSPTGQFEITAMTNTEKYPPRRFDWRASLTVHDGGLIEHNIEFPFEAPTDGYQNSVEFAMPAESPDWKRAVEKNYFIRFGTPPTYGRINIRFNGATQKAFLRYTINPTGSRNLERPTDDQFSDP